MTRCNDQSATVIRECEIRSDCNTLEETRPFISKTPLRRFLLIDLYNFIKPATQVKVGCDYSVFKRGIRPMWEDRMNEKGGRWIVKFGKKPRDVDLNKFWLDVILIMIGGQFDEYRDEGVCGAILNVRDRCDKVSIWTPDINREEEILRIGRKLKECIDRKRNIPLNYESHKCAEKKSSSNRYLYSLC